VCGALPPRLATAGSWDPVVTMSSASVRSELAVAGPDVVVNLLDTLHMKPHERSTCMPMAEAVSQVSRSCSLGSHLSC
jgi:hypothetical protein